jgi:hypothetical protein
MIGLRPLMLCLLALLNTAFWAGILHLTGLFALLSFSPAARLGLLAAIFVVSLLILLSMGANQTNGNSSDPGPGV